MTHANPHTHGKTSAGDTQSADPPVLDHETLRSLADAIGWQKVSHFIRDFTDHANKHREAMRHALANGDFDALYRSSHMLVSVSGSLGALATSELCDKLQKAAQASESGTASRLFDEVDRAIDLALGELQDLVVKTKS